MQIQSSLKHMRAVITRINNTALYSHEYRVKTDQDYVARILQTDKIG
jgi:hypothetical protein